MHDVLHPLASHAKGTQDVSAAALQSPFPSHADSGVNEEPVQDDALQEETGNVQASRADPSQLPRQAAVPAHVPCAAYGSPATALQVPTLPVTEHASHFPVHGASQQTPSVQ